jgi:UDP-N-acetylglucosamine--N-acetylmuramyl-(pentapeptide) pyrophosphoryl-undecaprenol N-acetylglucosamine transferase
MVLIGLSAGGSGGHVLPALALADEWVRRGHLVVMATDQRGLRFIPDHLQKTTDQQPSSDLPLVIRVVRTGTLRKQPIALIKDLFSLGVGLLQAFDIMRDLKPAAVVGFGGYSSFPLVAAGQILRTPTILHSADAVVGKANRTLARFCTRLALSFNNLRGLSPALIDKTVVTGLPLRPAIEALATLPYTPPTPDGPFVITIMGGSQGASVLGLHLAQILVTLPEPLRSRLRLTHQVRAEDNAAVIELYRTHNINAEVAPFFTDIPDRLATTHLFIGRAGASTVLEMALAGRPALYIPLIAASHHDAQQRENANVFKEIGAAQVIEQVDFTAPIILAKLTELMQDPATLAAMSSRARQGAYPQAAARLADVVEQVLTP